MKPSGELNPRVWQGDCFLGIDQNCWRMFWTGGEGLALAGQFGGHHRQDTAELKMGADKIFGGGPPKCSRKRHLQSPGQTETLQITAKRFSCVLGMLSSLEVKVLRPT